MCFVFLLFEMLLTELAASYLLSMRSGLRCFSSCRCIFNTRHYPLHFLFCEHVTRCGKNFIWSCVQDKYASEDQVWETHGNGLRSRGFLGRRSLRLSVLVFFFREESSLRVSERHREMQKGNLDPILLLPKKEPTIKCWWLLPAPVPHEAVHLEATVRRMIQTVASCCRPVLRHSAALGFCTCRPPLNLPPLTTDACLLTFTPSLWKQYIQ